mgnify:CR=1 FL=1
MATISQSQNDRLFGLPSVFINTTPHDTYIYNIKIVDADHNTLNIMVVMV